MSPATEPGLAANKDPSSNDSPTAIQPEDGHEHVEGSKEEEEEEEEESEEREEEEEEYDDEEEGEEEDEDEDEDEEEDEEEGSEEEVEGSEEEAEEDEEDEEPKLNYQRLGAGIGDMLKKDSASCTTVSDRFLVRVILCIRPMRTGLTMIGSCI